VGVDNDPTVAQILIKRDFGDVQALGNLVDAELLLAVERLGHDSRALRFFREARRRPPTRPRARAEVRPAWVRSRISSRSNSAREAKRLKHEPALGGGRVDGIGEGDQLHALLL
jgi:hypothetical protein